MSQEMHYDPALRGSDLIEGLRRCAGQCAEYADQFGGRNRLGPKVDLSGLDAAFGICVERTNTINGADVTGRECRAYLA